MADVKISALPAATSVLSTDIAPVVSGGITTKATSAQIVTAALNATPVTVLQGGTGVTTKTGTGSVVLSTSPTLVTPVLGTPASGNLANCTFPTLNQNTSGTASGLSATLVVGSGGTGATTLTGYVKGNGASAMTAAATIPRGDVVSNFGGFSSDGVTQLTANITSGSTAAIAVTSTASFPSSGYLICTSEVIAYTGKTSTTFTGITRGQKGSAGAAHSTNDYISFAAGVAALGTATAQLTIASASNVNFSLNASTFEVTAAVTGLYSVQFKGQIINCDNADDNAIAWINVDGVAVAASTGYATAAAKTGTNNGTAVVISNAPLLSLTAGQKVTITWSSKAGNAVLGTYQPIPTGGCPYVPATALLITQVG